MLLELLLLGLIVFVIGPIVYVSFIGVCLCFLLKVLTVGLERVPDVHRPTPVTKPALHKTGDWQTFEGCGRKDSIGSLHSRP